MPSWWRLEAQTVVRATVRALAREGMRMAQRRTMIVMDTRSSRRVKADRFIIQNSECRIQSGNVRSTGFSLISLKAVLRTGELALATSGEEDGQRNKQRQ